MRMLQRMTKFGLALLLTTLVGTAAYGQACVRYLNVTDGSDLNDGLTSTTPWQSFEFAYNTAPDGCVIRTAAGEYFQADDNDGINLSGTKSLTFEIDTFGGSEEVRFSEDSFTLNTGSGESVVIKAGTATSPAVHFGAGVINIAANFPGNTNLLNTLTFTSGTLDIQVPVTVDAQVTTINHNTAAAFSASSITYSTANRTINVTGSTTATAGAELPQDFAAGTVTISTTAGTYTSNQAHTMSDGGTLSLTGAGNATFAAAFTTTTAGAASIVNAGSGTLAFDGGLVVNATASPGLIVDNQSTGAITASSTTFVHQGTENSTPGDNNFTATLLNSGTGTLTTGLLTDQGNADPDRVLVTTDNATTGTYNVGGSSSTIGGDLLNSGTFNLQGDVLLEGNLTNNTGATINTGTYTLTLAGSGTTYANAGDIAGNGTVELDGTAVVDADGLAGGGPGGNLPNVLVTSGSATINSTQITGNVTINSGGTHAVTSSGGISGDVAINGSGSNTTVTTTSGGINGNVTISGSGSNTAVTTVSGIDGNVSVTDAATVDINGPDILGTTAIGSGAAAIDATTFGNDVSTSGTGALTFDSGAATSLSGSLTVGGSGTVTNTTGTVLTINNDLNLNGGTFWMQDDVVINNDFMQTAGSTLDFNTTGNALSLRGNFTRTGGTVIRGDGLLSFTGETTQTFQGGPNFTVWDAQVIGLNTNVVFQDGSLEVENMFTIGNNASVDLGDRIIRLVGQNSVMQNDGSYTAGTDGAVIFGCLESVAGVGNCAAAQLNQRIRGNGLYSNVTILQEDDAANVLVGSTPGLEVTMSGTLTFQVGGIDLNGQGFDLSNANGTPIIRRNLGNAVGTNARPDGSDGGFFTGTGTFNSSGTDYNIEYFGALVANASTGTFPAGIWDDANVLDVTVSTSGAGSVQLDADHSFAGKLTVNSGADLDMNGNTLTSTGTDQDHSVAGSISGGTSFTISGSGSVSGGGTVSTLTINTPGGSAFDVNTLLAIHNLNVNSGTVSVGLDVDTADNPDTPGDIDNYNQTGGDVSLTTDLDIGENAGTGTFNLTGGTFNGGDWDVFLHSSLTSDDPASFVDGGDGFFIFKDAGTINNDVDGDGNMALLPRLQIDAGAGNTVLLTGNSGVTDTFTHTTGTFDLGAVMFHHQGTVWTHKSTADATYGGTGTFVVDGAVTADLEQNVVLPNLTKNSTNAFTLTGDADQLEVTTLFTANDGETNQGSIDILLSGAGTAFDYNGGTLVSTGGEFIFNAGAAQTMTFANGLDFPYLIIKNDVTADGDTGPEVFNVQNTFTFGNGSLLFADNDGNLSFSDGAVIIREGSGSIDDISVPEPQTPIFPDPGTVDVWYLAAVTTDTELPGDADDLGTLRINPGSGNVTLDKPATANTAIELITGNLATSTTNTITIADGGTVLREQGTLNTGGAGSDVQGTSYTLIYDISGGGYMTESGEFPDGPTIDLDVMGDDNRLTLHANRTVASLDVTLTETAPNTDPAFDLAGWNLTVTGDANISETLDPNSINQLGTIGNTSAMTVTFDVNGNLVVNPGAAIDPFRSFPTVWSTINVNVGGDATLNGNYNGGTIDVDGNTTIGGTLAGNLVAAGDVEVTTGVLNAANITFDGFQQMFNLNGPIFPNTLTLAQSPDTDGNQPWVKMDESRTDVITIGTLLNLNGGLLITGDNIVHLPTAAQSFTHTPPAGVLSHVVGNVRIFVPAGTPGGATPGNGRFEYPVGSMDAYRMAAITFEGEDPAITSANITVSHVDQRPTGLNGFPLGPITGPADFYWTVTSSVGFGAAQTFDLEFLGEGFTDFTDVEDIRIIRRLDGDVTNTWVEQGGNYDNFLTTPPDADPLVRVTDTQGGLVAQGALFSFGVEDVAGLTFLQVIHAAADASLSTVDVYIDDALALDDFAYRSATQTFALDVAGKGTGSTATFNLDVAPGNSTSAADAILSADVELTEGQVNVAVALDDAAGGAQLVLMQDAQKEANDPTSVDVALLHGVSDAGAVDVRLFETAAGLGPVVLTNVGLADGSDEYLALDPQDYTFEFLSTGTSDQLFASSVDLTSLDGKAVMAIAHGLLNPPVGREGSRGANVMVVTLDGEVRLGTVVTSVEEELVAEIPTEFSLEGNYPNPFSQSTTIEFDLPATAEVSLQVIDLLGRQVLSIPAQTMEAGAKRTLQLNAANLASGTYLYRLTAVGPNNTWVSTGKMMLIK